MKRKKKKRSRITDAMFEQALVNSAKIAVSIYIAYHTKNQPSPVIVEDIEYIDVTEQKRIG